MFFKNITASNKDSPLNAIRITIAYTLRGRLIFYAENKFSDAIFYPLMKRLYP